MIDLDPQVLDVDLIQAAQWGPGWVVRLADDSRHHHIYTHLIAKTYHREIRR